MTTTNISNRSQPVTFFPGITADDALAAYWLRQVTARMRREVCWCWHQRRNNAASSEAFLSSPEAKAVHTLDLSRYEEDKRRFFMSDPTARFLTERIETDSRPHEHASMKGSFNWVVESLGLDDTSTFVLALGLATTFDSGMGSVIAVCLSDPGRTHASLALAQMLWDRPEKIIALADPTHKLYRYGLLTCRDAQVHTAGVVHWDDALVVPALVQQRLVFPDSSLPEVLRPITDQAVSPDSLSISAQLTAERLRAQKARSLRIVPVCGPRGAAHQLVTQKIARVRQKDLLQFVGSPDMLQSAVIRNALAALCWLNDCDLYLSPETVTVLLKGADELDPGLLPLSTIPITIFLGVTQREQYARIPMALTLPAVTISPSTYEERIEYWAAALGDRYTNELRNTVAECARRFRYEKKTIATVASSLCLDSKPITQTRLEAACRAEMDIEISDLAQPVRPRFDKERLILPAKQNQQFSEVLRAMRSLTEVHYEWGTAKVWNESGIAVLFAGPSGTGKTMAAEILALKLDLPLYRIDLSQVVNKYIGETEKRLKRLFDAADVVDTILFFDEADALFGKRTEVRDSHDRYANVEISYLLERMERFKGLAILATNRKKDLDEAFLRRLRYIIDFTLPEAPEREKIWRQVVPAGVDDDGLDYSFLARRFPLAGGHIRSIVFNACLQSTTEAAPDREGPVKELTMKQVLIAVKREHDKLNRSVSLEQFGPYADLIKDLEQTGGNHHHQ